MARHAGLKHQGIHDGGQDTTMAAVLLKDGIFERVDEWTPIDEILEGEAEQVEPEEVGVVIVPIEDYEQMLAASARASRPGERCVINPGTHQRAAKGWVVMAPGQMEAMIKKARLDTLCAMLRYVWFNASNLWEAMRCLLAITQKWRPDFIKGMSGQQIAKMLGVTRQAFNKQSIKMVDEFLQRWGVSAVQGTAGGSKGERHREIKKRQMMGRRHRAKDYEPEEYDAAPAPRYTRAQLDAMADEAETKRLANLAGVKPEELNLEKTKPAD